MKTFTRILTIAWIVFFIAMQAKAQTIWNGTAATDWTGSGTEANPYVITTAEQLAGIAAAVKTGNDFSGKFIKLARDIVLNDPNVANNEKIQWTPIGEIVYSGNLYDFHADTCVFRGTFDGAGFNIKNCYYNQMPDFDEEDWNNPFGSWDIDFTGWYKGFFGYIEGATIKNLNLVDATVYGGADVGGLVCINKGGTIINCSVTGKIRTALNQVGGAAGGLVAINDDGIIENCRAEVDVKGMRQVGGLVGSNGNNSRISNSYAQGKVYASQFYAGGFAGYNSGIIENCYTTADVEKEAYDPASTGIHTLGGFVGANGMDGVMSAIITDCYATGNVQGNGTGAGGFAGHNGGTIANSYAMGNVSGYQAAGFVMSLHDGRAAYIRSFGGSIINCFSTGNVSSTSYDESASGFVFTCNGEIVNCYYNSEKTPQREIKSGRDLRTTAQMQSQAFVDTLNRVAALFGLSRWEYREGDYPKFTGTKATNLADYLEGGTGSENDPFRIKTKTQLENFAFYVSKGYRFRDKYVKLTADIALNSPRSEWGTTPPTQWKPIGFHNATEEAQLIFSANEGFCGTFDGDGHEISNLYIDNLNIAQGLFDVLTDNAVVKNLGVVDAWVRGKEFIGILAGYTNPSSSLRHSSIVTVIQCWTSGVVEATVRFGGGLIGRTAGYHTSIKNSYSTANVKSGNGGGLVGSTSGSIVTKMENVYFAGTMTGAYDVLAGYSSDFTVVNGFYDQQTTGRTGGQTTAYLQSKEFANVLNYWVSVTNEQGGEQYLYWQHSKGEYPKFMASVPPHSITYNSNGGSPVTTQWALDASKIVLPPAPVKEGYTFAGWYSNENLTTFFDFNTEITASITLYAKWFQKDAADTGWFNQFATTFIITTKEQLAGLALLVNGSPTLTANDFTGKTVKLGNDILLNDTTEWKNWGTSAFANQWTPIGTQSNQFKGVFDGAGYKISGVYYMDATTYNQGGLFGYVGTGAEIKNLGVTASFIKGLSNVGGLAGYNNGGTITKCFSTANVNLVTNGGSAGGLIGTNGGAINNCYATGNVNVTGGTSYVGGLIGSNSRVVVNNCYATGNVSGTGGTSYIGGLIGSNYQADITNSYYNRETTGQSDTGKGTPKTTVEMKQKLTFVNWNFTDIWGRNNAINNGYPYLRWTVDGFIEDDKDASATVTFNSNGGSNVPAQTVTIGLTATAPETPTKEGYRFLGWYSDTELTTEFSFTTTITADITLYAKWSETVIPVTGVALNKSVASLLIGETEQLTATVTPENATNKNITWSSNAPGVATVANGLITALSPGTAKITVTTENGGYTAYCIVEVSKQDVEVEEEEPVGEDGKGKMTLSLTIPANTPFSGSFVLTLPDGMQLDVSTTRLASALQSLLSLNIVPNAGGSWTFTITPLSLRSATEVVYSQIVEIGYTVDETVTDGAHEALISNLSFEFENGVTIVQDELPVTITVNIITGIPELSAETSVYLHNGELHIQSPVAETIQVYSISGVLLHNLQKTPGKTAYPVNQFKAAILIVKGSSGWTKKAIMN